ncbi:SRPBCC family protein [Glutamicibacter endophyticus]|uniref:SRPBCC family protein n=1 Tax=Glutamicibacter endophyticus TaxID=1522174 RepID=UPI003AF090D6
MPVTAVTKDPETLTLSITADFSVPVARLWDAYLDARQIEKFWGPPGYPATFLRHDGVVGGVSRYYMTGPDGEEFHGRWDWTEVAEHKFFEVRDSFADSTGTTNDELPSTRVVFGFDPTDAGSRVTVTNHFDSVQDLEQLVAMGMEEGINQAMGQIESVLADLRSFSRGEGTTVQLIGQTQARVSRVVRGSREAVWAAFQDPELMKQWNLGPDGWRMPVCEVATEVGQDYRYEWEQEDGSERFGFTGTLLERNAPVYEVTTEKMIGTEGPEVRNELTLTPLQEGTLISYLGNYPSTEVRDEILATGMADGMEIGYQRLEKLLQQS